MAKKKLNIALIGCGGNMRNAHLPRFRSDGRVNLVAVADPAENNAKALIENWGQEVTHYTDYKKMVRSEELDAVVISSPHSMHYEQARFALNAGLHTLVEKPLTISARHTRALLKLSEKKDRMLVVSYQRHFMAPHQAVRKLIREGALGEIRGVVAYVTQGWVRISGWRIVPELSGGGMFMDTGSHLVGATLWMTGLEAKEVFAFMDNAGKAVDINAVVNVKFRNGALGTLNTLGNTKFHDERIAIHGSEGCIVFHLHQWKIKAVLHNDQPLEIPKSIKETTPDEEFFKWIRNGGKGYEPPLFALQVNKVSEAAYKSLETRAPVKV